MAKQKDNKDFTDARGQLDTNWQFPLLREVGTVIVEQSDESVSSQTDMRLVAHRQLLCVGITADCLEKQEQPNITSHAPLYSNCIYLFIFCCCYN